MPPVRGRMIHYRTVDCPYCGEAFETNIDTSAGSQEYIEDCQICCRPITFRIEVDYDGDLITVDPHRDDD